MLFLRFELDLVQYQIAAAVGCSQMHVSRILAASVEALRRQAVAADAGSAARLFVSHRMAEYHLSKVFTKLNIRSRNALDQALTTESSPAPAR